MFRKVKVLLEIDGELEEVGDDLILTFDTPVFNEMDYEINFAGEEENVEHTEKNKNEN